MNLLKRPLILASKSPRRHFLLKEAGFEFTIQTKDTDESYPESLPVVEVAEYLAIKKAKAVADFIKDDEIILASDTTVVMNHELYHKPIDRIDAIRILTALSDNMHQVITGVCLLSKDKVVSFSDVANVHFLQISKAEIEYYIDTYQPYDKAGAYAIQEWIGLTKIKKIEGTYANIMGLPVSKVYKELMAF